MRKRVYGRKLSRDTNERKALFRSLAVGILTHGRIDTTEAKAKAVRPWIEKLVTRSKENSLHSRRTLLSELPNPALVEKLLSSIGPTFAARPGGYTRVIRIGPRLGDNAPIVRLEFVETFKEVKAKPKAKTFKPTKAKSSRRTKVVTRKIATKKPVARARRTK